MTAPARPGSAPPSQPLARRRRLKQPRRKENRIKIKRLKSKRKSRSGSQDLHSGGSAPWSTLLEAGAWPEPRGGFLRPARPLGKRSLQLLLSRRPRTLKARGSHLKPGNAQTGNPLPPKQFLASRLRGAQLKQNDPHLLISSVATKRLAIYAATLNKDIWLFPGSKCTFAWLSSGWRQASAQPPASWAAHARGFAPSRLASPAGVQAQSHPATGEPVLTPLPAQGLPEALRGKNSVTPGWGAGL